jgi:hypothetical protein
MARTKKTPAPVAIETPAVVAVEAPVAAPAPVVVAGAEVALTKSQQALLTAKHGGRVMPGQVGKQYTLGGKPYRVRTATNAAQWNAVLAAMQAGGGTATVEGMVQQGFPLTLAAPFVAYAVNRGWLTEA